jgi:uncharacterized protein YndB with AHSA1/START domain
MTNALQVSAPEGLPFIDFEREFDAPVDALFRAHKEPDLIQRWMGPSDYESEIEVYDFRTGGRWRYVQRNKDGEEYAFNGVFHVVRENEFAIQTFEFEMFPEAVSIESITFEDLGDGRSRVRGHATYPSLEARDGMVSGGMEEGMNDGYQRLDALLATLLAEKT